MKYFLYYIVRLQFNMAFSYQFIYMIIRPLTFFTAPGRYPHKLCGAVAPTFGKHRTITMTTKFTLHLYINPLDYRFLYFVTEISICFVNVLNMASFYYTNS